MFSKWPDDIIKAFIHGYEALKINLSKLQVFLQNLPFLEGFLSVESRELPRFDFLSIHRPL